MDPSGMSEQERQRQKQTEDKEDYSLEQLYELLSTVQSELDGMRANPQVGILKFYRFFLSNLENSLMQS